ncbi:polysaccharide deacetylase family protein [Aerococcaceae bacterium DSM 111020]|nr:polysaccharide deacetylase family protein [Aerococcaceae bacterium DSM 111020]
MKIFLLALLTVFMLSGCQSQDTSDNENVESEETVDVSTEESVEHATSESETTDLTQREDGVPHAWTDYSAYAEPNEEGYAYEIYPDPDISSEILPITPSSEDVLLFTFDDAPQSPGTHALEMAQLMKEKDVNAIFLVNGMYLENDENIETMKQVHELGFEIGNHTETHEDQRLLTYEQKYQEIKATNDKIEAITGQPVRWFRPPFGSFDMDTILICNELGLQLINWSFGYDWMDEYLDGDALAAISLDNEYLRGGANILMHDREWTYHALERMIDGYREKGYHIVDPYLIKHQRNSEELMQ